MRAFLQSYPWIKWALLFVAGVVGSFGVGYILGGINVGAEQRRVGEAAGIEIGRASCPKPTKIPEQVEKWRRK